MGLKRFAVFAVVMLAWCLYQADIGLGGSVLTKEEATKDCGAHLYEWYTGCSKSVCFKATSVDYIIHHECRPVVPEYEVPDTTNCAVVSNSSLTFPDCCPYVQCDGDQVAPTETGLDSAKIRGIHD
ncbi:uncharacterized protein LOC135487096 isoform X2 [Lineus longissimus]|uniref:uncharacterized protein LOC135487096 isoform X2 n=1 Tax=Lineus longissimus TaxID=88925 RepID=UPI00315D5AB6